MEGSEKTFLLPPNRPQAVHANQTRQLEDDHNDDNGGNDDTADNDDNHDNGAFFIILCNSSHWRAP